MLNINCPICEIDKTRPLFTKQGLNVVKCIICGLNFVNPQLTVSQIESLYDQNYYLGNDNIGCSDYIKACSLANDWVRFFYNEKLTDIEKRTGKRGRLLDIGCAFGYFLKLAKDRGWEAFGVELSEFASNYGRANLGLDIFSGKLEDANFGNDYFDVITGFEVIEHVPDPGYFLVVVFSLLKPGGLLVLNTPNDLGSIRAKLSKDKSQFVKLPEHLFFFSPKTIKRLLLKYKFIGVEAYTFHAKVRFIASSKEFVQTRFGRGYRTIRPLFRPIWRLFLNTTGLGEAIIVYARKPFEND